MILKVNGQKLEIVGDEIISEGALNFVTFEIQCDKSWEGFIRTVRFSHKETKEVYDVPDVKDKWRYYIPSEVLFEGEVYVSVLGVFGAEHVATTTKASFNVEASIDHGKTPSITTDAYATFVSELLEHRRICEKSETTVIECLEECRKISERAKSNAENAENALKKSKQIFEEVSGILDAVGSVMKDIFDVDKRLNLTHSKLAEEEDKRVIAEKERRISEENRRQSENQRKSREIERQITDSGRVTADNVRSIREHEREERIKDLERIIEKVVNCENSTPIFKTVICGEDKIEFCEGSAKSIHIKGKSHVSEGKISGLGEEGKLNLEINSSPISLSIKNPLYSIDDVADEVIINDDLNVNVLRRIGKIELDGKGDFIQDDDFDTRVLYATAMKGDKCAFDAKGMSSLFRYSQSGSENCVWISGEYIFFYLNKEEYPSVTTLVSELIELKRKGTPLTLIYPLAEEKSEAEGTLNFDEFPQNDFTLEVKNDSALLEITYEKNLFDSLLKMNERIDKIEKSLKDFKDLKEENYEY
ncbi:MAG: hypothetical protein E7582_06930 [Ruminococcaceae bacterium]|nr:hypothetical protein [Oscillospiraceae bacterium]